MDAIKMPDKAVMHGKNEGPLLRATQGVKEFMHPAAHGNLPGNPLTTTGERVMRKMKKEYGSEKGKDVFYASINKNKSGSKKLHK